MNYDAVIFDLFGTLVDSSTQEEVYQQFAKPSALLSTDTRKFAMTWWDMREERGTGRYGTIEGDIRHVCEAMGIEPDAKTLRDAIEVRMGVFERLLTPRATVIPTLQTLRNSGIKIGLISDCGLEVPEVWKSSPFGPLFDVTVFSSKAGATKPDPRLYQQATEGLGVEASRCIYIGDGGGRELTGARTAGMHPILIKVSYEDFMDGFRPDAREWTGPIISDISEVLGFVGLG